MGCDEDVVAFLHDGPSDGMAITIFGSLRSINRMTRVPSRIPISVLNREKEREVTEQPTRDRDRESPFGHELNVRYLKNIKRFKNRIKSSYSCNQELCPMIKERMEQHQLQRHSSRSYGYGHYCRQDRNEPGSRSVMTSPTISRHHISTKSGPNFEDNIHTQTNINDARHINNKLKGKNIYNLNEDDAKDVIPLKRSETREMVAPKRNIYKDYVQNEVRQWFQEVPIYPNLGNSYYDKDNMINDLTEKINNIAHESNDTGYEQKVKMYIDDVLKVIPMWYPGAKRDQDVFKNKLNDNLFNRIKDLNTKMLNNNIIMVDSYDVNKGNRRSSNRYSLVNAGEVEEEINNWLSIIKLRKSSAMQMGVSKRDIIKSVMRRIAPLLKKPLNTCHYKLTLKSAIFDVLNDLPVGSRYSRNKNIELHKFAEDLTNRLLSIQSKYEYGNGNRYPNVQRAMFQHESEFSFSRNVFENVIRLEVDKCLTETRFSQQNKVKREITNIVMDYVDSPVSVAEFDVKNEIHNVLKSASNITEHLASSIAQNIIKDIKSALNAHSHEVPENLTYDLNRKISVFTSEEKCCPMNYPVTSTPKKARKSIQRLNPEEIEYTDNVGKLIRAWMETLPVQFNAPEQKDFKETIINVLAGEITDAAKLEQLASVDENEKWLKYLVFKWLHKLDVFDLEEVAPQIENLLKKLKDIPIPKLTRPQHGNRQAMANLQHMEGELGWKEYFVPKGKYILEDEISIWMNEQPSDIFDADLTVRDNKIQELAEVLENKLSNKRPEKEILNDVEQWLSSIIKPEEKKNVAEMAGNLNERVINLPQDITLANARDKKKQQKAEHEPKRNHPQPVKIKTSDNDTVNLDKTMNQFIVKFIEHNYDIGDPMARRAFVRLLKTKLQRLNPPTRKEVYDNFSKSGTVDHLSREKLTKELEYIKDISDWLKNIPIDASYNTIGNRERIDFVNDLAKNILEVEEQREINPDAMDYNMYMASIISQFLVQLPILEEHKNDKHMMFMIDQLVGKVTAHRKIVQDKVNDSIDTSGIHDDNIGEFIEEFIRINGSEIADDELKIEAWSVRLLDEIKKMVRDNADPIVLSKAQVYNRLTNVPLPGDESIKQFDNEFEYIKEISEWIKKLPLLPLDKNDEEERVRMVCELTEKLSERETKKMNNPNDTNAEAEFADYLSKWISDLSLDESHEVIVAVVIQQLVNRIEKVKVRKDPTDFDFTQISDNCKLIDKSKQLNKKKSTKSLFGTKNKQMKNPATVIVETIEKWSASLHITADDEKKVKSIRDETTKKIFQKVGELNIDPRTYNDDLLYQDIISDEVDAVIEKLSQSSEMQKNKEKLRDNLVQNIIEAHKVLKENYAGEVYKHRLENTIAASIPHPVKAKQVFDPAFEIYKSHLADMFILENFDHANDAVKTKYERNIKSEIDKYYESVKNKNALRLTNDEIYSELYSVLFKVPIPNEASVIGEVEEIKTRCEIDAWFEELPLEEASGITELLERDKILATLAKRIHEIEKADSKPADKIHKEIMKWLVKLPLLHGPNNIEQFAKNLEDALKSSTESRKCIVTEPSAKNKKGKSKTKSKDKSSIRKSDNQTPGSRSSSKIELELVKPKKKAADIVIEMVEAWCYQLPVYAITPQEEENAKMIRDDLFTKIIIKVSELNMNPSFNDDFLYNDLLDEELDKLLSAIPTCCDFDASKAARKMQLIDGISSLKPLFREEKAQVKYEQDLNNTVDTVLSKPQELTAEKESLFNNLKEEIVENFVQYSYDKADDEGRQVYKMNVHDAVLKFLSNVLENKNETMNALMRRNQLLCELAKIPIPSEDGLKEEVEEIRLKNDITEFFDDLAISEDKDEHRLIFQVKSSLAKKLNSIEMNGHTEENEARMKQEISKSFKKLNKDVKPETVAKFVNRLKDSEYIRRAPRKMKIDTCPKECKMGGRCGPQGLEINNDEGYTSNEVISNNSCLENCKNLPKRKDKNNNKNSFQSKDSAVECECPKDNSPEPEKYQKRPQSPENVGEDERCVCGGPKKGRRRPCFVPMRWCGPDDMPTCGMPTPAGFFYY